MSDQKPHSKEEIERAVNDLMTALGTGAFDKVESALCSLGIQCETNLYKKVGNLARTLHEALAEFQTSLAKESISMHSTNVPDAANKLERVIQMTQEAAEKTFAIIDRQSEVVREGRQEVQKFRDSLCGENFDPSLRNKLNSFLDRVEARHKALDGLSCEVVLTQEFQDLSGQMLRKVIKLVQNIEKNLIDLIKIFGHNDIPTHDPKQAMEETALKQDDVDATLKSFGF